MLYAARVTTFKRKVFYLGGFDPRGARFYHNLLAEQVAAHNGASPETPLTVSGRSRHGQNVSWSAADGAGTVETRFEFLVWDDLVRRHWVKQPLSLLWQDIRTNWNMLRRLDRRLAMQWPPGSRFTLFYPGLTFIGVPMLLMLLGWAGLRLWLPALPAAGLSVAAGLGLAVFLLRKKHSIWLLRFVIFNDLLARRRTVPELDQRLEDFAAAIATAFGEDWDEVLFVTHSNGSILAVPVLARLLERHGGALPAHFALITLGCCIQLLAARRDAKWYHALLERVSTGRFAWLDIGSMTDGACAPLVDPCQGMAVSRPAGLVQLSPRWFRYCDPATYRRRRRDKYNTHFDYLRRLDRASPLDYLGLTCAARPLAASIAAFEAENA
jgi:hypothetical protein